MLIPGAHFYLASANLQTCRTWCPKTVTGNRRLWLPNTLNNFKAVATARPGQAISQHQTALYGARQRTD